MPNVHQPVMATEVIHYLNPRPNQNFVDGTLGGGGHLRPILERAAPQGKVLALDLDQSAIDLVSASHREFVSRIIFVQDNFKNLKKIINVYQFDKISGILLDLGLSSNQLQDNQRGFSFWSSGRLDMRFGETSLLTAEKILNQWPVDQLIKIFQQYGEEPLAKIIARQLIAARKVQLITSPRQVLKIVSAVYKKHYRRPAQVNPATKVFQALRIAVNDELANLEQVLPQALAVLESGGRLVVISYHSLEDRMVKNFFRQESRDCLCPPSQPTCQCDHKKALKIITKKPVTPRAEEITANPRSRSAKLRAAEKL